MDGPPEGGARYLVESRVGKKIFSKFNIDVVIGEQVLLPLAKISGKNWLEFAGIPAQEFPTYSLEQHFADKIHAYTKPTRRTSRIKDFVDLILLIRSGFLKKSKLVEALELVFKHENVHSLPTTLQAPPADWEVGFRSLAQECGLSLDLKEGYQELASFLKNSNLAKQIKIA